MCRLFVLFAVFITLGPLAASAQEATPSAGEPEARGPLDRTDTRYALPLTADGSEPKPDASPRLLDGICDFESSIASTRPDAWGCRRWRRPRPLF